MTAWAQTFGDWGRTASDGNAARSPHQRRLYHRHRRDDGRLRGASLALRSGRRLSAHRRSTSTTAVHPASIDIYDLAAYAGAQHGPFGLRFGSAYSWHDLGTSRTIVFPGIYRRDQGELRRAHRAGFRRDRLRHDLAEHALEPFAGLAYVDVHTDGFTESRRCRRPHRHSRAMPTRPFQASACARPCRFRGRPGSPPEDRSAGGMRSQR